MNLGLSQRQRQSQHIGQSHYHTQALRLAVADLLLARRRDLIHRLTGDRMMPHAQCPKCDYKLTPAQILKGFLPDPYDFTTRCPRCRHRFEPRLKHDDGYSSVEVAYYCPEQTLGMLRMYRLLSPKQLRTRHPAMYHSALIHFGTIGAAFERLGEPYQYREAQPSWQEKVSEFLGLLPDTDIARSAGVSRSAVYRLRTSLNIAPFSKAELYEEMAG